MTAVKTKINNNILEIELNRPEKINAINQELILDLHEAVKVAKNNTEVRAVLIYGKGRGFCSGGDLQDFGIDVNDLQEMHEFLQVAHEVVRGIYSLEKPVIAAVHGPAIGAGFNIALNCDIIIADEEATFSQAFSKIGAIPDLGGLYFLPQIIGMHKAAELIFTGKTLNAKEAFDYGLINEIVAAGEAIDKGRVLAKQLAEGPTKALGMAKKILHQAPYLPIESILELESYGQTFAFQTRDFQEGRRAFHEKRKPKFIGH